MANFHANYLAIAAREQDMCRVLARMGMNLAANKQVTSFDMNSIEGLSSARDIFYQVGGSIESYYMFAFAGAPLPDDADKSASGWASPTSSAGGFADQIAGMAHAAAEFNRNAPEGVSLGVSYIAPVGRGLSDSAIVNLTQLGNNWALTLSYDTAWTPNTKDIDTFFMGLPAGEYGVAFFDADEYNDYETISAFAGLHHGLAGMTEGSDIIFNDVFDSSELKVMQRRQRAVSRANIADLAELARVSAICGWHEFGWSDDDDGGEDFYPSGDDGTSVNLWDRPVVSWTNPSEWDKQLILTAAAEIASALPLTIEADTSSAFERHDAAESLLPGDTVLVQSQWDATNLERLVVTTLNHIRIAKFPGWIQLVDNWETNRIAKGVLSLMLPHVHATIDSITPLSLRNKGADGPKMSIRLDLTPTDFDELKCEIMELLQKGCTERSTESCVKGAM